MRTAAPTPGGESKPEKRRLASSQRVKAEAERSNTNAGDARPPFGRALPALHQSPYDRLRQRVSDNTCPISGLTDNELDEHVAGVANMVIGAKGWDRIRAEYGDTMRSTEKARPRRACLTCGRPTRALSQICPDHPLDA